MAAELGLSIDSSGMKPGLADLDSVVQKSQAAEQAATKMGQTVSGALKQAGQSTSDVASGLKATADNAGAAAEAVTHAANAHSGLSIQGQAAFHSLRGLAEQLAYGVPPTQALTSHLNQLSFAASGPQGLVGAFGEAIGVLGALVTPAVAVTGSIVGMGLAAVGAAAHWQSAETDISRSLLGIGGASQATVKSIEAISDAIAGTGKLSFGEAREAATAIASLGTVNVKLFAPLLDASHNLSIILGKDVTESAKMAGAAIGDLSTGSIDGILKLNQSLGFLNGTLLDNIQNLVASGKAFEAQKLAVDAMRESSKGASDTLTVWGVIGQTFKNFGSDVINKTGAAITAVTGLGETLADQYDRAAAKLNDLKRAQSDAAARGFNIDVSADIEKQQKVVDDLQKKLKESGIEQFTKEQDKLGLTARLTADGIATEYKQVRDLKTALANINNGPAGKSGDPEEQAAAAHRLVTEIRNLTNANGSVITIEQRQTGIYEAQLGLVTAIGASEKDAAVAAMARAQAVGTATDGEVAASRAVSLERASINTAYQNSLQLLQAQEDVAGAITGADRADAVEQANIVQLLQQGLSLEQATSIAAQQRANSEAAASASVEQRAKSMNDQAALIRAQLNGTEEQVAAQQAYNNALDAGASYTAAREAQEATINLYQARQEQQLARIAQQEEAAAEAASQRAQAYMEMHNLTAMEYELSQATNNWNPFENGKAVGNVQISPLSSGPISPSSNTLNNVINKALASGLGLGGAAQTILNMYSGQGGYLMPKGLDQTAIQALSQITDLMTSSGDTAGATSFLRSELANLQQQPETLARDQLISQLNSSLQSLTQATQQNTAATVGLDSIYSGGHSALAIGYYGEGESDYNYDPNGFFRGGKNYTAPSQSYDPNAGYQAPSSSGGSSGGPYTGTMTYGSLSGASLYSALGLGTTPGPQYESLGIPHYADGGTIEPYSLAYVGEHSSSPKLLRAGSEPIRVTPNVPDNSGTQKAASTSVVNFYQTFNARQNDLGDRRTRRQVADSFGNSFRAQVGA